MARLGRYEIIDDEDVIHAITIYQRMAVDDIFGKVATNKMLSGCATIYTFDFGKFKVWMEYDSLNRELDVFITEMKSGEQIALRIRPNGDKKIYKVSDYERRWFLYGTAKTSLPAWE